MSAVIDINTAKTMIAEDAEIMRKHVQGPAEGDDSAQVVAGVTLKSLARQQVELEAASTAATADATAAAVAAQEHAAAAQVFAASAATVARVFTSLTALQAWNELSDPPPEPNQGATVVGDTEANDGLYGWNADDEVWERRADNANQKVATLETGFGFHPIGIGGSDGSFNIVNQAGFIIARLTPSEMNSLSDSVPWLVDMLSRTAVIPNGGRFQKQNEAGFIVTDYEQDTAVAVPQRTIAEDLAITGRSAEYGPLLAGKNISMAWGESKAEDFNQLAGFYEQLLPQVGGSLDEATTVSSAVYFHNAYDLDELIADVPSLRTAMDAAFAGPSGAECVSFIVMNEQANDMLRRLSADAWEALMLQAADLIWRYSLQSYKATDATRPPPMPPIFMTVDCTYAFSTEGSLSAEIPLRSIDLARRHPLFGIAVADYICEFNGIDYRHYSSADKKLLNAYHALAWIYWRVLGVKFEPTQVVESWLQGDDFYLRCITPRGPLVADTALVTAIADNGLRAFTAAGAQTTISGLTIIGGSIIKGTVAASIAGGGWVDGAMFATTPNTSGKATGPRMPYRCSTTYTVDLGSGDVRHLYSPLQPFVRYF